jgi:hypothetical protein
MCISELGFELLYLAFNLKLSARTIKHIVMTCGSDNIMHVKPRNFPAMFLTSKGEYDKMQKTQACSENTSLLLACSWSG